jgi:hypothetical protein
LRVGFLDENAARAAAEAFLPLAQRFCDWLEEAAGGPVGTDQFLELHAVLAELQAAAARLPPNAASADANDETPDGAAEEIRVASVDLARRAAVDLPANAYAVVFDALDESDRVAIMTTLENDLGDMHADLKSGMTLLESGWAGEAVWLWWFSYWNHWGRHAAHAQTAIWAYLAAGNSVRDGR